MNDITHAVKRKHEKKNLTRNGIANSVIINNDMTNAYYCHNHYGTCEDDHCRCETEEQKYREAAKWVAEKYKKALREEYKNMDI